MRRRIIAVVVLAMMSALMFSAPASAHQAPCADELGPGHSEFAKHHIVPLANKGLLGQGGHIPGEHRGFAGLCGVLAPPA